MKIKYEYAIFSIALVSIIARLFLLHPTFSDDNFYFNAAKVFISGNLPYKDFFFAHPPLQLFLFGSLFKIFGTNLVVAKIMPLISSTLSFVLIFFVGKKIFDEKSAFVSAITFLLMPAFLSFSLIGYGIFFTMALLLLSILFYLKNKNLLSAILFVSSVYVRYFAAPLILIFLVLDKARFKKFFLFSICVSVALFTVFYGFFGFDYLSDTILFHLSSKIGTPNPFNFQYWSFNFPLVLLSLVAIGLGFFKKEKVFVFLSVVPLLVDIVLLVVLRAPFYHYFMLSLPFYALIIGKLFTLSKDKILQILIFGIILFAVYNNIATIDYYLNPYHANKYFEMASFISNNTNSSDKIIGDPSAASFIAFTANISVPLEYTDSFTQHILYEGPSDFVRVLQQEKPKFFIESYNLNNSYYFSIPEIKDYVMTHYYNVLNITGIPTYYIYQLKS